MQKPDSEILKIENVHKRYRAKEVLRGVSFDVHSGEVFGIIGMSGVGKTTLLQLMMGIIEPESGQVLFKPEHLLKIGKQESKFLEVTEHPRIIRKLFGFAAQTPSFYPELTVTENLRYFGSLYGLGHDILSKNIDTVIKLVALENDRYSLAGELSGGMQKRLDIACALVHDPNVLILDEPTADLDPVLRNQIWSLIRKINSIGTTVLIASHFIDEIEKHCDRLTILHNRTVVDTGTPMQLKQRLFEQEHIILETAPGDYKALAKGFQQAGLIDTEIKGHEIWVHLPKAEPYLTKILQVCKSHGEKTLDIQIKKSSLQEVFDKLIKEEGRTQ